MNEEKDKYYTNQYVVAQCIKKIIKYINPTKNDFCIEPSAGNGFFISPIKSLFSNYAFYDLYPEHKDIVKKDFLKFKYRPVEKYDRVYIIGNPPFGIKSSLAIKFIKKSCKICDVFAFILPKSFHKQSMKKQIPLNFHLIHSFNLPKNSFLLNGQPYDVNCVFQIWKKKNKLRKLPEKVFPIGYKFVNKYDNPNISFRRVGVNSGKIDLNYTNKSDQSHYFIKFDKAISNDILEQIKKITFSEKNYTVGPLSISKQELVKKWNPYFR